MQTTSLDLSQKIPLIVVDPDTSKGRVREADAILQQLGVTLQARGLSCSIQHGILKRQADNRLVLWAVHDLSRITRLEAYQTEDVIHHLSTAIRGREVLVSNSSGLRYCVLLSRLQKLPTQVTFPGVQRGYVLLGQAYTAQPVRITWKDAGHMLVGGMTGSGKSSFLRTLVYQGIAEGCQLYLADRDGTTFPMLAQQPQLAAPIARTPAEVLELVEKGLGECDHRAALFEQLGTFPDNVEEYNADAVKMGLPLLPRLLVILDEYNATVTEGGGVKGALSSAATTLGWRGRKFGVNLVFAAQAFSKDIVGHLRDQVSTMIVFRVRSAEIARAVGCPDAVKMTRTRPGLAYTDRWQYMQAYYLDKAALIAAGQTTPVPALTAEEQALVQRALEAGGRMSIPLLGEWGMKEWPARKLLEEWELRGWVKRDSEQKNARVITPKMRVLFSNTRTAQTASNSSNTRQGDSNCLSFAPNVA